MARVEREHQIGDSYRVYWQKYDSTDETYSGHGYRYRAHQVERMSQKIKELKADPTVWKVVIVKVDPVFHWVRGE